MDKVIRRFVVVSFTLMMGATLQAGVNTILSFDEVSADFTIGLGHPGNVVTLTDELSDFVEGSGSMKVRVELTDMVSWGTWTDISYLFPTAVDLSGYTELRFSLKILREPRSNSRTMQFTMDVFEDTTGGNSDFWRYPEDQDIFYTPHTTGAESEWFDVIIPVKNLVVPIWASSANGVFDGAGVYKFAFGVHADSATAFNESPFDTVEFLIDDLRGVAITEDGLLLGFEEIADSITAGAGLPDQTTITLTDDLANFTQGSAALNVKVELREPFFIWGTWTDIGYQLPAVVLVDSASEVRFDIKMVKKSQRKNLVFTFDLFDNDQSELHRWGGDMERPGHTGLFNHIDIDYNEWREVVMPIGDMYRPSWSTTYNDKIWEIKSIAFGVHARLDAKASGDTSISAAVSDTVEFIIDNIRLTHDPANPAPLTIKSGTKPALARSFSLSQNYPNPFNPTTSIHYIMTEAENNVSLNVYNIKGVLVRTLVKGYHGAGEYHQVWDGLDNDGKAVASGIYIYNLKTGTSSLSKNMVLLK